MHHFKFKIQRELRDPRRLVPHPLNEQIYPEHKADEDLVQSIKAHGLMQAVMCTPEGQIISGHRRVRAAILAGLDRIWCEVLSGSYTPLELEQLLLEANRQRVKTNEETARECRELLRVERDLASQRQAAKGSSGSGTGTAGDARDHVGEIVGLSGKSVASAVQAVNAIDAALATGDVNRASHIQKTLNTQGYKPAARLADRRTQPPGSDLRDSMKNLVPERLRATFEASAELAQIVIELGRVESKVANILETANCGFRVEEFKKHTSAAQGFLKVRRPYAVCRACGGDGDNCQSCGELGWVEHDLAIIQSKHQAPATTDKHQPESPACCGAAEMSVMSGEASS